VNVWRCADCTAPCSSASRLKVGMMMENSTIRMP
jgi:hypothetical protein